MRETHSQRCVFAEFHDGIPDAIMVEEMVTWRPGEEPRADRSMHDVDNVAAEGEAPDLWHEDVGGQLSVELSRFSDVGNPGFQPAEIWWADGVEVKVPMAYDGVLSDLGYRRIETLPDLVPEDDPFRYMREGRTVWCDVCQRRFPEDPDGAEVYMAFPEVWGYDVGTGAAKWCAAELLRGAAERWHKGDWERVWDAFEPRISHEVDVEVEKDAAPFPAQRWRIREDLRATVEDNFDAMVKRAMGRLAAELEDETGIEEREHLCPHVWWEDDGVGWTGPGVDP